MLNNEVVYAIYTDGIKTGNVLKDISQVQFNGISCIKGTGVESWVKGKTSYIPVDKIEQIVEFDSVQDYNESVKKYEATGNKFKSFFK